MNLEKILISYATYDWKEFINFINISLTINIWLLILLILLLCFFRLNKCKSTVKLISHECQTQDVNDHKFQPFNPVFDMLNLPNTKDNFLRIWYENFSLFQKKKIISQSIQVTSIDASNLNGSFDILDIISHNNLSECMALSFRLKMENALSFSVVIKFNDTKSVNSLINVTKLAINYQMIVDYRRNSEIFVKLSPEEIMQFEFSIFGRNLSESEKEMRHLEFERDFRIVLMKPEELKWSFSVNKQEITKKSEAVNTLPLIIPKEDKYCQVDDTDFQSTSTNAGSSMQEYNFDQQSNNEDNYDDYSDEFLLDQNEESIDEIKPNNKSHLNSAFSRRSRLSKEIGEFSPFHERFKRRLMGRTLILRLIRIVNLKNAKVPKKKGFWTLELNEPYQNQTSHLKRLITSDIIWDQNFVFNLNCNSQRLLLQLKCIEKKGKKSRVFATCVLSINDLIFSSDLLQPGNNTDHNWHFVPLHIHSDSLGNIAGSTSDDQLVMTDYAGGGGGANGGAGISNRASWRCDSLPGLNDGITPALQINLQVMVHDSGDTTALVTADSTEPIIKQSNILLSEKMPQSAMEFPEVYSTVKLRRPKLQSQSKNLASKIRNRFSFIPATLSNKTPVNSSELTNQNQSQFSLDNNNSREQRTKSMDRMEKSRSDEFLLDRIDGYEDGMKELTELPRLDHLLHQPQSNKRLSTNLKNIFFKSQTGKSSKATEKSLEKLFEEKDPKHFDLISEEGYNKIKKL